MWFGTHLGRAKTLIKHDSSSKKRAILEGIAGRATSKAALGAPAAIPVHPPTPSPRPRPRPSKAKGAETPDLRGQITETEKEVPQQKPESLRRPLPSPGGGTPGPKPCQWRLRPDAQPRAPLAGWLWNMMVAGPRPHGLDHVQLTSTLPCAGADSSNDIFLSLSIV